MNIQELWTKAGGHYDAGNQHTYPRYTIDDPEKFAALVAAHEREACATLLESGRISCPNNPDMEPYIVKLLGDAAFVIRKRGEV